MMNLLWRRTTSIDALVEQADRVLREMGEAARAWKQAARASSAASKQLTETITPGFGVDMVKGADDDDT